MNDSLYFSSGVLINNAGKYIYRQDYVAEPGSYYINPDRNLYSKTVGVKTVNKYSVNFLTYDMKQSHDEIFLLTFDSAGSDILKIRKTKIDNISQVSLIDSIRVTPFEDDDPSMTGFVNDSAFIYSDSLYRIHGGRVYATNTPESRLSDIDSSYSYFLKCRGRYVYYYDKRSDVIRRCMITDGVDNSVELFGRFGHNADVIVLQNSFYIKSFQMICVGVLNNKENILTLRTRKK